MKVVVSLQAFNFSTVVSRISVTCRFEVHAAQVQHRSRHGCFGHTPQRIIEKLAYNIELETVILDIQVTARARIRSLLGGVRIW